MALTSTDQLHNQELKIEQQKTEAALQKANMLESLMITSQRINLPGESGPYQDKTTRKDKQETEGQKLERKGGYIDTGELDSGGKPLMIKGMPPAIDPEEHKKAQKKQKIYNKAADPEAKGAEKEWLKRTGAQLPKFNIKPADLLKILQFLPALTGLGSPAMAHVNKDGTAHDWRAPGHGGLKVPGGEVNPHGRRGTNTWDDGRQKYTPEELKQIEDYMKSLQISNIYQGIPNAFDKILDPSGTQKVKPTLDQLRRGVKYKKGLA